MPRKKKETALATVSAPESFVIEQSWAGYGVEGTSLGDSFLRALDYGRKTISGVAMGPDIANSVDTYFACKRVIAEDCAVIPIDMRRVQGSRRTPVNDHPVLELLNRSPDGEMTGQDLRQLLIDNSLGWGGGFAEIVRRGSTPAAMNYIHPNRVRITRGAGQRLIYLVRNDDGSETQLESHEMFHVRGMSYDGINGYSIARLAMESLGAAKAMELFGGAFFGNGANSGTILTHPGQLKPEAAERLRQSWATAYTGVGNAHKTVVLQENMRVDKLGIPMLEAQFVEGRRFATEVICRWFRCSPHKVGDMTRMTFNNIEHAGIDHVVSTLMPHLRRIELQAEQKLLSPAERKVMQIRHNVNAFLRGDVAARGQWYKTMRDTGAYSVNDIRDFEDMEPVEGGDVYLRPLNHVPLDAPYVAPEAKDAPATEPGAEESVRRQAQSDIAARWAAQELHRLLLKEAKVVVGSNNDKIGRLERANRLARHFNNLRSEFIDSLSPVYESVGESVPATFADEWGREGFTFARGYHGSDEAEYVSNRAGGCE